MSALELRQKGSCRIVLDFRNQLCNQFLWERGCKKEILADIVSLDLFVRDQVTNGTLGTAIGSIDTSATIHSAASLRSDCGVDLIVDCLKDAFHYDLDGKGCCQPL
jgi:hypothetical protein